jgi:hypothetical protein
MASHTSASASVEASDRPLSCSNRRMRLVGADVVEVAPAYDHAEMTTVAAAHVAYELLPSCCWAADTAGRSENSFFYSERNVVRAPAHHPGPAGQAAARGSAAAASSR